MKKIVTSLTELFLVLVLFVTIYALATNATVNQATASDATLSRLKPESVLEIIQHDVDAFTRARSLGDASLQATETSVSLCWRSAPDARIDTVTYYRGSVGELRRTPNPRDFPLYRKRNSEQPTLLNFGLVLFAPDLVRTDGGSEESNAEVQCTALSLVTESSYPRSGRYDRMAFRLQLQR